MKLLFGILPMALVTAWDMRVPSKRGLYRRDMTVYLILAVLAAAGLSVSILNDFSLMRIPGIERVVERMNTELFGGG